MISYHTECKMQAAPTDNTSSFSLLVPVYICIPNAQLTPRKYLWVWPANASAVPEHGGCGLASARSGYVTRSVPN